MQPCGDPRGADTPGLRSFRDHALETTADGQVLGLSVRVVHNGVWGFASDITLLTDSAAHLTERAVATAKVSVR